MTPLKLLLLAFLLTSCYAQPSYYPLGPQTNVPKASLSGWTECWSGGYEGTASLSTIISACGGDHLLLACGPTGDNTLTLLAAGSKAAITTNTGTTNTPTNNNGVGWYNSDAWSWGFAKEGDGITRNSCDTGSTNADKRLCWHTNGGNIAGGWRCGASTSISSGWTRYVYRSSCFGQPDGTACNDGNACTQTDTCQSGVCVGSNSVTCSALDQCHAVGTCNSATGQCSNPNKPDATTCNDGNACTQTDTCQSGQCVGSNSVTCSALDQCHDVGTCDISTGQCSNPNKPDATSCDDGSLCTQTDTCQSGQCVGSNSVICSALDQCHAVGTCDSATGQCSQPMKVNGTLCDDEDACTQEDICEEGMCIGTTPVICAALNQCHDIGTCNTTTGECSQPFKVNNSTCDDGDACTDDDVCISGTCRGIDSCPVAPPQKEEAPIAIPPIIPPQYHQFVPEYTPAVAGKISTAAQQHIALYIGIFFSLVPIFM